MPTDKNPAFIAEALPSFKSFNCKDKEIFTNCKALNDFFLKFVDFGTVIVNFKAVLPVAEACLRVARQPVAGYYDSLSCGSTIASLGVLRKPVAVSTIASRGRQDSLSRLTKGHIEPLSSSNRYEIAP